MANHRILVPYNFMPYDRKALDFLIRTYSRQENAGIALFNTYTPVPEIESQKSPVMEKLKSNLSFMTTKIKEQEEALATIKQDLIQNGFSDSQVEVIFRPKKKKDTASEIITVVLERNFNVIVLNHKPGKISHFFTGNVFNKVITTLNDVTVCVIT